jgi:SAM-dependent methyltransferase
VNGDTDVEEGSRPTPVDGWLTPNRIANCIRDGGVPNDRLFDRLLRSQVQALSEHHWTPARVALRAAQWLEEFGVQSVLDIGSGAGKFCVVAALRSRAHFLGIEQRPHLVDAARELANMFELADRVEFEHGTFGSSHSPAADAYYLFNPFGENLYAAERRIDDTVEASRPRFVREVVATQRLLQTAPAGTSLITYHGFGGAIPAGYIRLRVDTQIKALELWRK